MTAYRNSHGFPIEDPRWLDSTGFARAFTYEPRSEVHVRPAASVVSRAVDRVKRAPESAFVTVIRRVENGLVHFPDRKNVAPIPVRSGLRTYTDVLRNEQSGNYSVDYVCDCGYRDRTNFSSWRRASKDTRCKMCLYRSRGTKPQYPISPTTAEGRARQRQAKLASYSPNLERYR